MLFFLQMAALSFEHLLESLQSPESPPQDMMTGYEALCFGDIHFAPPWCTMNMQWVSLIYLKSLVNDNSFQPEGVKPNAYSGTTAILIVFLSDEEHKGIEHVHIGLMVPHKECHLYMQDGILPFMKSIEADLEKARDRCTQNKDPGGVHSYSLLIANYGPIMAIPTDLLYCLVYPTMYNDDAEDQNHFNTADSPSGMNTHACMCHTLPEHVDKDPDCQRTYEDSCLIIPHSKQYRTLFPEIVVPHNHQGLLIDPNTGEPYPMATAGDFCLIDPLFPGSPGDTLLFKKDDLNRLKTLIARRNLSPLSPRETNTSLPVPGRTCKVLPAKRRNHTRPVARTLGHRHPGHLTPQAARSHLAGENALPQPRNSQTAVMLRTTTPPPLDTGQVPQ